MKKITKVLTTISLSVVILCSITLGIVIPQYNRRISLQFHPASSFSYPEHTAWIIAEVESKNELNFSIKTSSDIPSEIETWLVNNTNYLVEIFLHPTEDHLDDVITVEVIANSEKKTRVIGSTDVEIINWTTSLTNEILTMRNHFLDYISENTTFSNINSSTVWEFCGTPAQILIVEHYLFKSQFWELELSRHVMIQPHDWVQVYLRPRNQVNPIWSVKVDSWGGENSSIYEIEPPSEIFR